MKFRCLSPTDLTSAELTAWESLCEADSLYRSPFLRPDFVRAVARHRPAIEVAICAVEDRPVGFFGFERTRSGHGRPVGGRLADYHGPVIARDIEWSPLELLRACGLVSWRFSRQAEGTPGFRGLEWSRSASPFLDLESGFESYCKARRDSGSQLVRQAQRKSRKLAREVGPLSLEWSTGPEEAPAVLQALLAWKELQRQRTRTYNVLREEWSRQTLETLLHESERGGESESQSGSGAALATLRAGNRLVAAHVGLTTRTTLHWWIPAYDPELARHSPGLVLLLLLAEEAASRGITRLDLGRGDERYKDGFSSDAVPLAEGSVETRRLDAILRRRWLIARDWLRASPLQPSMTRIKQAYRRLRHG